MHSLISCWRFVRIALLLLATQAGVVDIWSSPAFSADPSALRHEAETVKAAKHRHGPKFVRLVCPAPCRPD